MQDRPTTEQETQDAASFRTRLATESIATIITVLAVIYVVQDLSRQPVLVTSLASSTFLLYHQPLNRINRFRPLILGHLLAAGIGYVASLVLPIPYVAASVSLAVSVVLMDLLRIVHPPAVSTSLVFAYRPHDVDALATFALTLLVVVVLALAYLLLRFGGRMIRSIHLFGPSHGPD